MARLTKLKDMPAFPAGDFTKRLHERVLTAAGKAYPVFDPALPTSLKAFVAAIRSDHDKHNETRAFASDTNDHLVRVDDREARHYTELSGDISEIREAISNRPFLSGLG